ncbi:MAG: hypothetical protein HFE63_01060 [Clostridiales bacterium]|nr:hypothetical protein [Clostridiales bacterium]
MDFELLCLRCGVNIDELRADNRYIQGKDGKMNGSKPKNDADGVDKNEKSGIIKEDVVLSGHSGTPKKAEPNSVIDCVSSKTHSISVRTFYGVNGLKIKDIHTSDHGNPKNHPFGKHGEHVHEYIWNSDGSLKTKTIREINSKEQKDNSDIL